MSALWVREADVAALLDLRGAIAAVARALLAESAGDARDMAKTHAAWGGGDTLHALGGVIPSAGVAGAKTWAHTAGGAMPLLVLFDAECGALLAVIEAFALGQLRTSAVSAIATDRLAVAGADELAMIGSGRQALGQIAAVAAVRPLRRVRIFSPTQEHRVAFAARVHAAFGIAALAVDSLAAALDGAPIVTLATRAREPFVAAQMLAAGVHVNAIGAITPERAELLSDVLAGCALVAVDSVAAARRLSRELGDHYRGDDWSGLVSLSRVVAGAARRERATDMTLFKAMGIGLADVAIGREVLERARRAGRGDRLALPTHVDLDWTAIR